jgi:hypothetical protein
MKDEQRVETANLVARVVDALHMLAPQLVTPAAGSRGSDDLANAETRRSGEPWGTLPVETYITMVSSLRIAALDHLHGCAQVMRDDVDFGPGVMARCTLEAAGKLMWLLDPDLDLRARVGRGYAIRIRGLRDNARNIGALAESETDPDSDLVEAVAKARERIPEVIGIAHGLGFKTERHPDTREFTGLVGLSPLGDSEFGYEAVRHLQVPPLGLMYAMWSAMAHSTYDALRNHMVRVDGEEGLARIGTTNATRIIAGGLATIGALNAVDHLIVYFGVADPAPCLDLDHEVIPALKELFLAALDDYAASPSPAPDVDQL